MNQKVGPTILSLMLAVPLAFAGSQDDLARELGNAGLTLGAPIYIRVFKKTSEHVREKPEDLVKGQERFEYKVGGSERWDRNTMGQERKYNSFLGELQVYVRSGDGTYRLFKTYPVGTYTGTFGPKKLKGDGQTPEGFYSVTPNRLKPNSQYHRAFDIGYPNSYDRAHGYTGSLIEVHGTYQSDGCLAMGPAISEIYALSQAALKYGQSSVPVHIFPFPLEADNLARYPAGAVKKFWTSELLAGYEYFEKHRVPPRIEAKKGHYRVADAQPEFPNTDAGLSSPGECLGTVVAY